MAGAAAAHSPYRAQPPPPPTAAERWEVEFARFFNFPRRSPSSTTSYSAAGAGAGAGAASLLRSLRKMKLRSGGTWIAAASIASLRLLARRPASVAVLSVSIGDDVIEEHFVSNLHFSWPQVSCDTQCPIRGSRVMLLSYRDSSNEARRFDFNTAALCTMQFIVDESFHQMFIYTTLMDLGFFPLVNFSNME